LGIGWWSRLLQHSYVWWGPFAGEVACCSVVMMHVLRGIGDRLVVAYGPGIGVLRGDYGWNGASFDVVFFTPVFCRSPLKGSHDIPPISLHFSLSLSSHRCWCFLCSSASAWNCQYSTSPGVFSRYRIYIFSREEGSLSCLRLTQGVAPRSTTRLYRGYVNLG
jgi:hypothetical protein